MATFTIAQGSDDAKETAGAVVINGNASDHELDSTTDWSGLRFQTGGSGPPQGATITACSIALTITSANLDEPLVTIYGDKSVSSATFSTAANNISGRTLTSASVVWSNTDLGAGTNTVHSTADLSTVAQELVNQASWTASSPITFLFQGDAGGLGATTRDLGFRFYEYTGTGGTDPAGTYAAVLTITWTTGGGGNAPRSTFYHMTGVH